jgi:hypothetical protein
MYRDRRDVNNSIQNLIPNDVQILQHTFLNQIKC